MTPGSIVRCRNRDWVLLPSDASDVYLLRPLAGATDEVVAIHKGLTDIIGYDLPEERVRHYDREIRDGAILVGVEARSQEDARALARRWQALGARDVYT